MTLAKHENRQAMQNDPSHKYHGTRTGYKNYGCRCTGCSQAMGLRGVRQYRRNNGRVGSVNTQGVLEFTVPLAPFVPILKKKPSGVAFVKGTFDPVAARDRAADAITVVNGPHKGNRKIEGTDGPTNIV